MSRFVTSFLVGLSLEGIEALPKLLASAPGASRLGVSPFGAGSPPPALLWGFFVLFLLFFLR